MTGIRARVIFLCIILTVLACPDADAAVTQRAPRR